MTPQQIAKLVQEKADARLDETVGRLFSSLHQQHTHQCWKKECCCDYCRFINYTYVDEKLFLHKLKKRLRYLEYLNRLEFDEACQMMTLEWKVVMQKHKVRLLKQEKKEMQKTIL